MIKNFNRIITTTITLAIIALIGFTGPALSQAAGPAPVNLLSASNFTILSKTGITNTGSHTTAITGNIGASPITAAAMNNVFCSEMTGTIYGVDASYVGSGSQVCFAGNPPLSNKTLVDNAVLDMGTAYADASGRTLPTATELGAGNIGGMTLAPGLYKWSTGVTIPSNVTLSGSATDVWIFQIAGDLSVASGGSVPAGVKVILSGGALASNIFWQVGGATGASLGTYSTFNGNILSAKQVILQTGAVLNGRALAQTQVTLDANKITSPTGTGTIFKPGTISGMKYYDKNSNGRKNNGEGGLFGWTIVLKKIGGASATTTTDINGNYKFSNLGQGTYNLSEVMQTGWKQTDHPGQIKIKSGSIVTHSDFGNVKRR